MVFCVTTFFFIFIHLFCPVMDLCYRKLFKQRHCSKLSHVQSHVTFLSAWLNLKIPPNSITVKLPATYAPPGFRSSLSPLSYSLSMETIQGFQLEYSKLLTFHFPPHVVPSSHDITHLFPPHPNTSLHTLPPFSPAGSRLLLYHSPMEAF